MLATAVPAAVQAAGVDPGSIVGIATAFTASTPLPVLRDGTPLCRLERFGLRAHAYPKLWKHHAAQEQADRITAVAADRGEPWLARYGGRISSEWEFAKALQVLDEAPDIYAAADRWIEAADWIVWQLCGAETRNACTAGYKGIFQDGRYPSEDYLRSLDEGFAGFVADKLAHPLAQLGGRAGTLTAQAASWTGLKEGIAVAVGNVDAHVTAPAAQAIEPGHMLAVMGTSTCHVMNGDRLAEVPGMCGVVDGGITPGHLGYEAGQSGVGDIFGWFVEQQVPPAYHVEAERRGTDVHRYLSELASAQGVGEHGLVALDWHSGNRSVLVDHELSGVLVGATLRTRPEDIYRALIEATAFGTRTIIETFERHRGAGARAHRRGRAAEEPPGDADLLGRRAPAAPRDRVRGGPGSRRGHACRRGGGSCIRISPRQRRRWARFGATPTGPMRRAPTPTTGCTRTTPPSTTTSVAAR